MRVRLNAVTHVILIGLALEHTLQSIFLNYQVIVLLCFLCSQISGYFKSLHDTVCRALIIEGSFLLLCPPLWSLREIYLSDPRNERTAVKIVTDQQSIHQTMLTKYKLEEADQLSIVEN